MSGINKAITQAGSQVRLARALGVTQVTISNWKSRGWIPANRARQIEEIYGIPRAELLKPELRWIAE